MTKEFIPYEQALALKELGFDEPCLANYTVIPEDGIDWFTIPEQGITDKTSFGSSKNYNSKYFEEEGTISAPLYQQAFRWFREKYNLDVISRPHIGKSKKYVCDPINFRLEAKNTLEEAELACLKKLIEILKNDNTSK